MRSLPRPDNQYGYSEPYIRDILTRYGKWKQFRADSVGWTTAMNSCDEVVYLTEDVKRWMRTQNEERILV